ncbi:MAG: PTS transporter subunit EIIC [Tepidanaerobacter acetatoxydans]|uniref:PTS transporter subunit EIIC n=1 Tax=Tepidanaerobacter TaxID=499228 RepID=UPI000A6D97F4|nr:MULTISPECIES: PTS transporter subunit EIIC [Tepidanaerobacter]NLU10246.1 PTS transporter subunit EIIC [Tepidanaerobacter acetatoxydans]
MDKLSPKQLGEKILQNVGGKQNVASVAYCATRLRLVLKDVELVDRAALDKMDQVLGVVEQSGQFQVILGPGTAGKVANEIGELLGFKVGEVDAVTAKKEELKVKNSTPFKLFLRHLSNIFIPLIPAFVGCGVIYGSSKLLSNLNLISGNTYEILKVIGKAVFTYMNIMVGMYTAKEFGGSVTLGGSIAGILSAPGLANIVINGENLVPEQGGIVAVLIACMLGALLEKKLRKVIPSVIDLIVTPTLVLLIVGLGSIYIVHPLGVALTAGISSIVNTLINKGGFLIGALLSGTFLPLVMTGLHRAITPIEVSLLKETGIDLLRPILAMAGAGQVGAGIAIYVKTKNKKLKNIIASSLPVGMLGVGEPLMFGVTLPLGRPFITACLGSMLGGAYVSIMKVGSIGIGLSGLPLILLIPSESIVHYIIGTLLAYIGGFLLTYFTKWDDLSEGADGGMEGNEVLNEILNLK